MNDGHAYIPCPQQGCSVIADDEKTLALIKKEEVRKSYRHHIISSFVQVRENIFCQKIIVSVYNFGENFCSVQSLIALVSSYGLRTRLESVSFKRTTS